MVWNEGQKQKQILICTLEVQLFGGVCGHAIKAGARIGVPLSSADVAEADSFFAEELGVGNGMNEVGEDGCLATGMAHREGLREAKYALRRTHDLTYSLHSAWSFLSKSCRYMYKAKFQ